MNYVVESMKLVGASEFKIDKYMKSTKTKEKLDYINKDDTVVGEAISVTNNACCPRCGKILSNIKLADESTAKYCRTHRIVLPIGS